MRLVSIILILLFFASLPLYAQNTPLRQKAITLKRVIEINHYSPRPVDDSFSVAVFRAIVNIVDSRRVFFTLADYKQLNNYSLKLDDELNGNGWSFFDQLVAIFKRSLIRADSMIDNITRQPFNFSVDESVIASREATFDFAASTEELQKRWYRYLKFATARGIYYALHKDNLPVQAAKSSIDKVEPSIRNKLRGNEKKFIEDILHYKAGLESYMAEIYLDAIASEFDPHTNYFSQEGKEEFQSALSSQGLSFGIDFDENQKGQIVVDHLEPGGPAWKSGELHKNDELLQLQQEGKEPVDITEQSVEDIYEFLAAPGHDKINFKVRKNNGQEKTVTLKKEKINNEENVVKSFVLNGSKKIGYIILPGFYTEWENDGGSSCANDVAREIIKLKHENIEGLILDVRFNGGGSVGESLAMAGIFIDEGPLSGEKDKSGKLVFLKDPNRGVIFSGPMILLVNGQSASASELLAATLQDYNRALIMGGKTFGKATMQQMFFLDTLSKKAPNAQTNTDILKITTGKIFRLNGETAQLKGVVPDIELPDEFELMKSGERFYANALPADTARKNNYYKPLPAIPIAELATKSAARTSRDPGFIRIQKSIADLKAKQIQQTEIIPLKWEGFDKWLSGKEMAGKEEEKDNIQEPSVFTASVAELNKQWTTDNEDAKEWNNRMIKNIQNDIYMQEAFRVLCDWIGLKKTSR